MFVTACDTPFLNLEVVRYIASQIKGYEIAVPRLSDGFHPLQAVYTENCLPRLYEFLITGRLSLIDFLQKARARGVTEHEIAALDPQRISFLNINTPQDLELASALLSQQQHNSAKGSP